mmetsp:Transcript_4621/g.7099  ORF Transcript_4621/g.7099 Transcript_4621/m.7099 type:complete len:232 (+) Transcript_4621:757-1452(+)
MMSIPVNTCSIITTMETTTAARYLTEKMLPPCPSGTFLISSRISLTSAVTSSSGVRKACKIPIGTLGPFPFNIAHRGDSGNTVAARRKRSDGNNGNTSDHFQPSSNSVSTTQLQRYEQKKPTAIAREMEEAIAPLYAAAESSQTYAGTDMKAIPAPDPIIPLPISSGAMDLTSPNGSPRTTLPQTKSTEAMRLAAFLPYISANAPPIKDPPMAPNGSIAAMSCCVARPGWL